MPLPVRQTFTYRLPAAWQTAVKTGARLIVPFGKQQTTAYVVALHAALDPALELNEADVKEALELLDVEPLVNAEILGLSQWIADYYHSSWGEVLRTSLPAGVNQIIEQIARLTEAGHNEVLRLPAAESAKKSVSTKAQILKLIHEKTEISIRDLGKAFGDAAAKRQVRELEARGWIKTSHRQLSAHAKPLRRKAVRLLPTENHCSGEAARKLTEAQNRVVEFLLANNGEYHFAEMIEAANVSASAINTLEKRGVVETFVKEMRRDPLGHVMIPALDNFVLTAEQSAVLSEIIGAISESNYKSFLLHGVTGSGKTEVYIRAMDYALSLGKTALMLVPEIALTPVFARRLKAHFKDRTAILHSQLSHGERFDEWRRIKSGAARVVIGTRSAVFAPLENLGVIIVDEEHDGSYKQHEAPYYHGRDVAVMRAAKANAVAVLGSATPALETYQNAKNEKYGYLTLPNRVGNRPMAAAEIVDMREEFKENNGKEPVFSEKLLNAIEETAARGEQSMILLNRRGFSQFVMCRACGETVKCPNCDVTLTFHKRENSLVCHYCNHRQRSPRQCPACASKYIFFIGEGTEQIEDILKNRFSHLRIARVDRDTTAKKFQLENVLQDFAAGKIDMLVGTQMLAKGHDFPRVTLVGVVSVDVGLAMPDFRAAERTFQLITQVAGRAGRGDLQGRVLIQTFYPEHYALQHACAQDYQAFYEVEKQFRGRIGYPPYSALASFLIHNSDYVHCIETGDILRACLIRANGENACRILGPAPAPLARLKNEFRFQLLVKAKSRKKLRETIDFALAEAAELKCDMRAVNLEIDPLNLL